MTIELAITDETPAQPAPQLEEHEILDCFLATPMQDSYRDYLVNAGRAIEQKVAEKVAA